MKRFEDLKQISVPFAPAVVTIGNFDGVHVGHQALFSQVIEKAKGLGGTSVVVTFEPHPVRVLNGIERFPLITLYEQKVELIAATGIDVLVVIPFSKAFAATPARSFVQEILWEKIGMRAVIVGPDYSFGKKREGNIALLEDMGKALGFEVIVSKWIEQDTGRISSTEIRNLVREGKVDQASILLGRHYQVRGTVTRGRDRGGKLLGFPTANLILYDELCPKGGVYAVTVEYDGVFFKGVANIGYSPTFDNGEFCVEVHILNFSDNIYGKPIRVNFIERLRGEKKFPGSEALAAQIAKDIKKALTILS
ncbi:MAG: bifunctional riboflavin kinase/FAD synthetase [Deltaproteobacteria bacterium]|nr:bifunctional riboflavin kinase/FAD synthetase [Deltaproteobacteria bacterium]